MKVIVWRVYKFLNCLLDLIRSAFKAYNLKAILGPKITLAKVIRIGFAEVFSQTIFHVLQTDANNYKPPSPKKKKRKHSIDSSYQHSQTELNFVPIKFETFFKKFSFSVLATLTNEEPQILPPQPTKSMNYQ